MPGRYFDSVDNIGLDPRLQPNLSAPNGPDVLSSPSPDPEDEARQRAYISDLLDGGLAELAKAYADSRKTGDTSEVARQGSRALGAIAGGELGASLGAVGGPAGALAGAGLGAIGGAFGGGWMGEKLHDLGYEGLARKFRGARQ